MEKKDQSLMAPGREFKVVIGDTGQQYKTYSEIIAETPGSTPEKEEFIHNQSLNSELRQMVGIQSQLQYEYYTRYEHELDSVSEKIYFLRLDSIEERENYLRIKGIIPPDKSEQASSQYHTDSGSIFWGMDKNKVLQVLGQPRQVDYAGDPRYENERWGYATNDLGTTRYIYFENGRVDGWEHVDEY